MRWTDSGVKYEPDIRHVETIVQSLVGPKCNSVSTPGTNEHQEHENTYLGPMQSTEYRALAARCNFLAQDRPDLQYAVKEVCRGMAKPTEEDMHKLKRIARYLSQAPRLVFTWPFQHKPKILQVYSDTDWAGCRATRKSTQGGVICYGSHVIKTYSSTQATIALSSGEAEYYGLVKSASIGLGVQAMYSDLGEDIKINLNTDASAAKAIASRRGLGKLRHLAVHLLWLQQQVASECLSISKVRGDSNPADILTKYVSRDILIKHLEAMSIGFEEGRAKECPELTSG